MPPPRFRPGDGVKVAVSAPGPLAGRSALVVAVDGPTALLRASAARTHAVRLEHLRPLTRGVR